VAELRGTLTMTQLDMACGEHQWNMPVESNWRASGGSVSPRESDFVGPATTTSLLLSGAGKLVGCAAGAQFLRRTNIPPPLHPFNGLFSRTGKPVPKRYKKLSERRVTARCVLSVVILPITTQQCRNYLYDKS